MKQKLFLALMAICAIGLLFVGCPNNTDPTPPPGGPQYVASTYDAAGVPKITGADAPFKVFELGQDDTTEKYNFTSWPVDSAYVSDDSGAANGVYKITVQTNPSNTLSDSRSFVSFNSIEDAWLFTTGYYIHVEFPKSENGPKPRAAIAIANTQAQDTGADWQTATYLNWNASNNTIQDNTKYLGGDYAFYFSNLDNYEGPYKTVLLTLYWDADTEPDTEYEFTLKKLYVANDPDELLVPPVFPGAADTWTQNPPVAAPAGWQDFAIDGTSFYPTSGTDNFTDNGNGNYSVTLSAGSGGFTRLYINAIEDALGEDFVYQGGFYMGLTLPTVTGDQAARPVKIIGTAAWNLEASAYYTSETTVRPARNYYPTGDIGILWNPEEENTEPLNSFMLDFYWHTAQPANQTYTFTITAFKVKEAGEAPVVPDLEAWAPDAVAEPSGWENFPGEETLTATYYPWATGTTGTTITTDAAGTGRTLVRLSGEDFKYKKGIYVSVTLPNNSLKPEKIYVYGSTTKLEGGIVWPTETGVLSPDGKFIAGKVDLYWDGSADTTNVYQGIILDIYWHAGQTVGSYSFTINKILVAEEYNESGDAKEPWTPDPATKPPAGLIAFTETDTLAMTTIPNTGTITKNGDGSYAVKVKARTEGNTRIYFTTANDFQSAFVSLTLPENASLQPSRIIVGTAADAAETGFGWGTAQGGEAPAGSYLAGNVDLLVTNTAKTFKTVVIYLYIPLLTADDFYEFTLKDLSVAF